MIQLFSADWCSACKVVKQFLSKNNISYKERDIDNDKIAYDTLVRLQLRSIPVIYLDDKNYVVGSDQKKILELVKKLK